MIYKTLGKTKMNVSNICYGTLTIGPLQRNMNPKEGASLLETGYRNGINIIDTAELYQTYDHIKKSFENYSRSDVHIFTKSYAYDKKTAQQSLEKALKEIGTDYLDGFLLHEQESEHTLRGHYEATEYFLQAKAKGYIRSFGVSSHSVNCIVSAVKTGYVDVIHPLINLSSIGILDGNKEDMLNAIKFAKSKDIGVYSMKPLGGGNLISDYDKCIDYILSIDEIDSTAIGMQSEAEIKTNILKFSGQMIPEELKNSVKRQNRKLIVSDWCIGCRKCEEACQQKAITVIEGKAEVDREKCTLCSYCASYCNEFCIKVI